jgi:PKD domain
MITTLFALSISLSLSFLFQNILAQGQEEQQQPPVSNAGPDQTVNEGDIVILNGTGSFDPDGKIVSYAWGIEDSDDEAPAVTLNGQNTSNATFTAATAAGGDVDSYLFELSVTDNDGLIATDTAKVVVAKGVG